MVGTCLAFYLNFMWIVGLATEFITHVKATPVDAGAIAYDIARFMFRGVVFFISIVVCNLPAVIVGNIVVAKRYR